MFRLSMKLVNMPCEWPSGPLCRSLDNITSSRSSDDLLSPGSLGNSSRRPTEIILATEAEADELRSKELRISCDDDDVSGLGSVLVRLAILKPVE